MKKEELLQELSAKVRAGEISREEIMRRLELAPATKGNITGTSAPFSVAKMLYVLGATIVVIGVLFFISQIWGDIGQFGRIAVSLGLGLLLAAMGSMLLKSKPEENIGAVFHIIGGVLIPVGAVVTLHEMSLITASMWPTVIAFGMIFAFYLLLNFVHKNPVLTFFAIANGTAFVYLLVEAMIDGAYYTHGDIYAYLTMITGASYLLLAHAFRGGRNDQLISILHFFGITGFLGAAFTRVFDSGTWELLFIPIVIGCLMLAVFTKSRSILIMSTVFLIAHVTYITSEYFADSIGWPISLVLLGFIFIGLGYGSLTINKKYIAGSKS